MRKEELIDRISMHDHLLANAVNHMIDYIVEGNTSPTPSREQTMAVNDYLMSIHADNSMSENSCELRRIASQRITIASIPILDNEQLNRLQNILDCIAYDKEYYTEN